MDSHSSRMGVGEISLEGPQRMSRLRVWIEADEHRREFIADGAPVVVVAAFREWLDSPDAQIPMAHGADDLEREVKRLRAELNASSERERLMADALGVKV